MDYDDLTQAIGILSTQAAAANNYVFPTDLTNILPRAIEYAEDRIYREMTFLATRAQDSSLKFTGNSRSLNLQNATTVIIVPEGIAGITPINSVPPLGSLVNFMASSLDTIDWFFPSEAATADITTYVGELYWAMKDANTIVVGPTPNAALGVLITGLFMPARISATNETTYISLLYPDLMVAASMIFISGYTQNFGAQSDQPAKAQSWEGQYKELAASATLEEQRRRGQGAGWSANLPAPLAKQDRT